MGRRRVTSGPFLAFAAPADPAPVPPPPVGDKTEVTAHPGDASSVISAAAADTIIRFQPGTYNLAEIVAKDGQEFRAVSGFTAFDVVFDGQDQDKRAFSGLASNVTIANITLQNYRCDASLPADLFATSLIGIEPVAAEKAAIEPDTANGAVNWTIEDCVLRWNKGRGITLCYGMVVRSTEMHDNAAGAIGGRAGDWIVDDCDIYRNNTWQLDGAASGGVRCTGDTVGGDTRVVDDCDITGSRIRENWGAGVAFTKNVNGGSLTASSVWNNTRDGVLCEGAANIVVRANDIGQNGSGATLIAEVGLDGSHDCIVDDNTIVSQSTDFYVRIRHQDLLAGTHTGATVGMNNTIDENTFVGVNSGAKVQLFWQDFSGDDIDTVAASNTWTNNTYRELTGGTGRTDWVHDGTARDFDDAQTAGFEAGSTASEHGSLSSFVPDWPEPEIVYANPGDNINDIAQSAAEGAIIRLRPGTYTNLDTIFPKDNQQFIGIGGADLVTLDGEVETKKCFSTGTGDAGAINVTIRGLGVTRFRANQDTNGTLGPQSLGRSGHWQRAAIQAHGEQLDGGGRNSGWRVWECHAFENHFRGISIGKNGEVKRCKVWRNGLIGIGGGGLAAGPNITVTDNDVFDNCLFEPDRFWESGGIKFVGGSGGGTRPEVNGHKVLRNKIHDNFGHGYWYDFNGTDIEVARNSIYRNTNVGIMLEAAATIDCHHNQIGRNGENNRNYLFNNEFFFHTNKESACRDSLIYTIHGHVQPIKFGHQRPGSDVDVGIFTGVQNNVSRNTFVLIDYLSFGSDISNLDCVNDNFGCTGVGACYTAGTPRSNTDTNWFCYRPGVGDNLRHTIDGNTYRQESGSLKLETSSNRRWPTENETNATVIIEVGATAGLEPDWDLIPFWDTPPGSAPEPPDTGEISTDDAYAQAVLGITNLEAFWRLQDTSTTNLADSSGNGHDGDYSGSPNFQAEGRGGRLRSWQASDGVGVNFAGAGHGLVEHVSALAPEQGTISFYFKATASAISNNRALVAKNASGDNAGDMIVRLGSGNKLVAHWDDGTDQVDLETQEDAIEAGVWHHCAVSWTPLRTRLWLDGRQVGWSVNFVFPMDSNTNDWTFANDGDSSSNSNVVLDEVALYSRSLTFDEIQILSEHAAGLGYTDAQMTRTVNVTGGDEAGLNTALSNAQPGDLILLGNGTYNGTFDTSVSGTRENPIVIRGLNGADNVTIAGRFDMNDDWNILEGVSFTSGGWPEVWGRHCRVTRIKNNSPTGSAGIRIQEGSHFSRFDHSFLGPLGDGTQGVRILANGPPHVGAYYTLADHFQWSDAGVSGSGQDGIAIQSGGGLPGTGTESYTTIHKAYTTNFNEDECITVKSSRVSIQFCTFDNNATYTNNRHGRDTEWRSCYWDNARHHSYGDNHWWIGCTFDGHDRHGLPGGETTQPVWEADEDGPTSRVASRFGKIIGCAFLNGAHVDVGDPQFGTHVVDATGWTAEGNTDFSTDPPDSDTHDRYTGTLSDSGSTDEPFETAVKLAASDVGVTADDPLVPGGWR